MKKKKTQKIKLIEYILDRVKENEYIHCNFLQHITGMKVSTAERLLRQLREDYLNYIRVSYNDEIIKSTYYLYGYKTKTNKKYYWIFEESFLYWVEEILKKDNENN